MLLVSALTGAVLLGWGTPTAQGAAAPAPTTIPPRGPLAAPPLPPGGGPIAPSTTEPLKEYPRTTTTVATVPPTTATPAPVPTTVPPAVTQVAPAAPTTVRRVPLTPPTTAAAVMNPAPPTTAIPPPDDAATEVAAEPGYAPEVLRGNQPPSEGPLVETIATGLPGYAFPFGLALLIVGYLVIQHRLDRRDPKLRDAPFERIDSLRPFHDIR